MSSRANLVLLIATVAFGLYCFLPVTHATWFIIDDHVVVSRMGTFDHLPFSRIWSELRSTEVSFGSTELRYRPLYYLFQFLESAVFGKDASLWYAFRVGIFCLFGATLFLCAKNALGALTGFAFTIFELSNVYWAGMFARLGSGETYGVFGLTLIALAFCIAGHLNKDDRKHWTFASSALLSVGLMICVGTKENMIPFVLLPIVILVWQSSELRWGAKVLLGLGILATLWVTAIVAYRVGHVSHDVYMREATLASRGRLIVNFLQIQHVQLWIVATMIGGAMWALVRSKASATDERHRALAVAVVANVVAIGFYFSQYVFYAGDWPNYDSPRYLFPGILVRDFACTLLAVSIVDALRSDWVTQRFGRLAGLTAPVFKACLIIWLANVAFHRFAENRERAWSMVAASNGFMTIVGDAVHGLAERPDAALVLVAHAPFDYEPVLSMSEFFRAYGGKNPIMLQAGDELKRQALNPAGGMETQLARSLIAIQDKGAEAIRPFSDSLIPACYAIDFGPTKSPSCRHGVAYVPPWEG